MQVTSIKPQLKRAGFFSVFLDGKYSFSLSETGLLKTGIKLGQTLTPAEFAEIREEATFDKLYNRTLYYISFRPRSEWEIKVYLQKHGQSEILNEKILNKLMELGIVDDRAFTKFWVENRTLTKPTSKRRLIYELRNKHVADEVVNGILEDAELDDYDSLLELVSRKKTQTRYKDKIKLMQYLSRQGYNYGDIKRALEED
jgi:regulatory protein